MPDDTEGGIDMECFEGLMEALCGAEYVTTGWNLDRIAEAAMSRHPVKKGRREHTRRVIDEAFSMLMQDVERYRKTLPTNR